MFAKNNNVCHRKSEFTITNCSNYIRTYDHRCDNVSGVRHKAKGTSFIINNSKY